MNIKIDMSQNLLKFKIIQYNIEDILFLLSKYFNGQVNLSIEEYDLLIKVSINRNLLNKNVIIKYLSKDKIIHITAKTEIDVIYGFYTFLSDILGFVFLHPEEIISPRFNPNIFLNDFLLEAESIFINRGFHLHTLHPIELSHFIFNEDKKHKIYIKHYIDHLVRLRQNTFQFYLLEKTDLKTFIPYIKDIIEYAHNKGIKVGIMLSLYRVQQYSYKLFKISKIFYLLQHCKTVIDKLLEAQFDYFVVETPLGEFLPDLMRYIPRITKKIESYITINKGVPLFYAKHIVKKDHIIMEPSEKLRNPNPRHANFLFRTVMCFSLFDKVMGAYENETFEFIYEDMRKYSKNKKIFFWPTSAYWVAFDNTIPLFLFPYLKARLDDIQLCKKLQIHGHITFSSGFEWGGFLIETSIANYSWIIKKDGLIINNDPLYVIKKIAQNPFHQIIEKIYHLCIDYLINKKLLPHLTGEDPFIEFPIFNHTFQPRAKYTLKYVRRKINRASFKTILKEIYLLKDFTIQLSHYLSDFSIALSSLDFSNSNVIIEELYNYLTVLNLRIKHKINVYYAALHARTCKKSSYPNKYKKYLNQASKLREEALKIISKVMDHCRYEKRYIVDKCLNKTSYDFSYFYPASVLFFWEREEKEVLYNRFNPFFMKLWDFKKILGLK
jgi:hypothetical protein